MFFSIFYTRIEIVCQRACLPSVEQYAGRVLGQPITTNKWSLTNWVEKYEQKLYGLVPTNMVVYWFKIYCHVIWLVWIPYNTSIKKLGYVILMTLILDTGYSIYLIHSRLTMKIQNLCSKIWVIKLSLFLSFFFLLSYQKKTLLIWDYLVFLFYIFLKKICILELNRKLRRMKRFINTKLNLMPLIFTSAKTLFFYYFSALISLFLNYMKEIINKKKDKGIRIQNQAFIIRTQRESLFTLP